ncbi:serine/threonine-protein kinase [Hyalangium versicolor]|uniref:serine/threonine-protein kinase n=1 Tax=Hyalangium versicolor TaxID=2861190 RepID=UPI001CCBAC40|nr:serine/threonine-protein kinase [Hyalangium versicolor]
MPSPTRSAPAALQGQRFTIGAHRYCAVRKLDTLGVGERILARAESPRAVGEWVLLKRLNDSAQPGARKRLLEEAWLLGRLDHPNIARLVAVSPRARQPVLVMEYVEGLSLQRVLNRAARRRRPMSPRFSAYVVSQIADALHAAHNLTDEEGHPLQLVHRDVSPRNIHLGQQGEVKLMDFGAAFTVQPGRPVTQGGRVKGDLAYAAPEVLRHERPDARADQFSLGLVLVELLTNQYVLDASWEHTPITLTGRLAKLAHKLKPEEPSWASPAELAARAESIHPDLLARVMASVPEPLKAIVDRVLRPRPEERYPSAAVMRDELLAFLGEQGSVYGGREMMAELRLLIARAPRWSAGVESTREPIPAEFRRSHARND